MIALLTTLSLAWELGVWERPQSNWIAEARGMMPDAAVEQFALEEKLITLASEKEAEKVTEVKGDEGHRPGC